MREAGGGVGRGGHIGAAGRDERLCREERCKGDGGEDCVYPV